MKKILFTILMLWGVVQAQIVTPPGYTSRNTRENLIAIAANTVHVPAGTTASLPSGAWVRAGAMFVDTTGGNKGLYYYTGGQWLRLYDTTNSIPGVGGIHSANAGYGLTQINDSTFTFSTALRDSIIGLIVPATITQNCVNSLDTLSVTKFRDSDEPTNPGFESYNGFPSALYKFGIIFVGYVRGTGHADSGGLYLARSYNKGLTYVADTAFKPFIDTNWRTLEISFKGDTLIATAWTSLGDIFSWYSVDSSHTWSAQTQVLTSATNLATQNHVVEFKGYLYMPVYQFGPDPTEGGTIRKPSVLGGSWSSPNWWDDTYGGTLNEAALIVIGDTMFAYIRSETNTDSMYRSWTVDGLTWSIPVAVVVPNWLAGKPGITLMPDGRLLMNYRSREIPNLIPDAGRMAISSDKGLTWDEVWEQEYDFNYGDNLYLGGDTYINYHSGRVTAPWNTIFQSYFIIPPCEIFVDGTLVNYSGNPLPNYYIDKAITQAVAAIPTIPGANNDLLFSDGNEAAKVVSGINISGSKFNTLYVVTTEGAGSNSQISMNAASAIAANTNIAGHLSNGLGTGGTLFGGFGNVGQGSAGLGYNVELGGTYNVGVGYQPLTTFSYNLLFGRDPTATKNSQAIFGGSTGSGLVEAVWGNGASSSGPNNFLHTFTAAEGTDIDGGNVTIRTSLGTGARRSGPIIFQTGLIGTTGSTVATPFEVLRLHGDTANVSSKLFISTTPPDGDADDYLLGLNSAGQVVKRTQGAVTENDTITIITPVTGVQIARSISPDSLHIASLVAGTNMTITKVGDTTIIINADDGFVVAGTPVSGDFPFWNGANPAWNSGLRALNATTFTVVSTGDTLATQAYARSVGGGGAADGGVLYIGKLNNVSKSVKGANIVLDSLILQSADELYPGLATTNQVTSSLGLNVDGQGGVVSTGSKGFITIPYNCTILNWYVSANVSGSIQFDIKRGGTSIVGGGGNKPLLSGAISGNAAVSGWTSVAVAEGDILEWNVDSATTITNCTVTLKVIKL